MLNLVVTCTKEKRVAVNSDCELRALRHTQISNRITDWTTRLRRCKTRVSARDLYGGDHWAVAREIDSPCFDVSTYVCSAGYGLIHIDDQIAPYSATFSRPHPDSVWFNQGKTEITSNDWWTQVCGWRGHRGFGPRSISKLAGKHPDAPLLIVASKNYLRAISADLATAREKMDSPDLLLILSAGTATYGPLTDNLLPCDARLQPAVGGVLRSLNVRLAAKLIREARSEPTFDVLKRKLRRLLAQQPDLPVYNRARMEDDAVKAFIEKHIAQQKRPAHSPLLRQLRAEGHACEQKRFASLFREVTESHHG